MFLQEFCDKNQAINLPPSQGHIPHSWMWSEGGDYQLCLKQGGVTRQ